MIPSDRSKSPSVLRPSSRDSLRSLGMTNAREKRRYRAEDAALHLNPGLQMRDQSRWAGESRRHREGTMYRVPAKTRIEGDNQSELCVSCFGTIREGD